MHTTSDRLHRLPQTAQPETGDMQLWQAFHLHYHGDRGLMLRLLVHPLLRRLARHDCIDRVYVVRYSLGGPHVRLRWRLTATERAEEATAALAQACGGFFQAHPANQEMDADEIRQMNRILLHNDPQPGVRPSLVVENHSWQACEPGFEVQRYGGPELLPAALDAFTVSTVCVLELMQASRDLGPERLRPQHMGMIADLALGMASTSLVDGSDGPLGQANELLGYAVQFMGPDFASCQAEADRVYERRSDGLQSLLEQRWRRNTVIQSPNATLGASALFQLGRTLARRLSPLSAQRQWRIASSQLHMLANRLGLSNAEEVYLSRLLQRAWTDLGERTAGRAPEHTLPVAMGEGPMRAEHVLRQLAQDAMHTLQRSDANLDAEQSPGRDLVGAA